MVRASSYNIYVDLPESAEDMLLVHGYTGAYDKVSRRVATYVRSLEAARPPKPLFGAWSPEPAVDGQVVAPSDHTIAILKRRGYLTELSVEDEQRFFANVASLLHQQEQRQRPSYILMPTYNCNLRCSYCFQDHMRTNPAFNHLLRTMRRSMADRIIAAMSRIEAQHGYEPGQDAAPERQVGFFGGEPLLEHNRPIIEYIMTRLRALGPTNFWAVSNATDLHIYRDLLGPDGISFLQITLDGPPEEHNQRRIYADGSATFERIARNITMALEQGVAVSVRLNIDRNNINDLTRLAQEMIDRGWTSSRLFAPYTAPIRASNDHTDMKTTFSSWELDQALDRLREQDPNMLVINRPDDQIKQRVRGIFSKHAEPTRRATFCGAHSGMYVFDAFGDIYSCWERTGDPNIRIGYVTQTGDVVIEERLNTLWRSRNVTTNAICKKCRYALYCGGGCAVLAEAQRGEFFTNYCDGYAARFRAMVAETYLEHAAGVTVAAGVERPCDM
jgi:uncharacterized protein